MSVPIKYRKHGGIFAKSLPTPSPPEMEYQFRPAIKFCRVCLWHDFTYEGNEFLRRQWMLCVPTICSIHGMPLEERG